MDLAAVARSYYDAIDAGDYQRLRGLLTDEFVQERPDQTLAGAETFVEFMREKRPDPDTSHIVEQVYVTVDGVAVEGRLVGADGVPLFSFVDTFSFAGDRIHRLRTYTQ